MKTISVGLVIGMLVGILDVSLFKFLLNFPVSDLDALGAVTYWTAVGLLVHTSGITMNMILKGIAIALLIGLAWLVDTVKRGQADEVWMLLGIFVFYGALTGLISGRMKQFALGHS